MKKSFICSIGIVLALAGVKSQARGADFSEPKKTVETCAKAIQSSDVDAIKACFTSSEPEKQKQISGIAQIAAASHTLKQAAVDKFGPDGNDIVAAGARRPGGDLTDKIQRLKDADQTIDGDTATLTAKADPSATAGTPDPKPLYFKKVGDDWKIDWDKQTAPAAGAAAGRVNAGAMMEAMTPLIAKAMGDTAAEIKAGKYASVDEAKVGLQTNVRAAFMAMMPGGMRGPGGQ
jgi:hypothetical protein